MKTRTIFATLALPATALGLFAQESNVIVSGGPKGPGEGVMIAQGAAGVVGLSGDNTTIRYFTQEFTLNGHPVTGAPYTADETTESVQTLADGTHITNSTTSKVYRDSQGRTRSEMSLPALGGDSKPHTMIRISDPTTGTSFTFDPDNKVAHQMPPIAIDHVRMAERIETSGPKAVVARSFAYRDTHNTQSSKHEDLGDDVIEGVSVKGSRETSTIETGAMGNDRPITITSERWFSPDLQIEVKSVHTDPRMGTTTHTVTNINRAEPDPSLFQVPAEYKLDRP